ncbi:MAG: TIGR03905 family TSCPD domain-containing protein [Sporomusaceae bacterium]|nr:TIGR03905 family TSCPD domain-containing protein [Sporomusaceae bacterium]
MNSYKPQGVCSQKIDFQIKDGKVEKIVFHAGCPGNLSGLSRLAEGMEVSEVIRKLKGITCSNKGTSCPDQLAHALEGALAREKKD